MRNYKEIVNQFDVIVRTELLGKTVLTVGLIDGLEYRTYDTYKFLRSARSVQNKVNFFCRN